MALPGTLNAQVVEVGGGAAVDAASAAAGRAALRVKCLGPVSVWVGPRTVDDNLAGWRLWPGDELELDVGAGIYLATVAGHTTRVALMEISA